VTEINSGTGAGLREFLDRAASRGEINAGTAGVLRAAVAGVLAVEDDPDGVDIRSLDVDEILERFTTLNRGRYAPASMRTYNSRFRRAVEIYLTWLSGDSSWRKVIRSRPDRTGSQPTRAVQASAEPAAPNSTQVREPDAPPIARDSELVTYRLPLRPGLIVTMSLPADLTAADADRVAGFVKMLAFDQPAASPAAAEEVN